MLDFERVLNDLVREAKSVMASSEVTYNVGSAEYQMEAARKELLSLYQKVLNHNVKLDQQLMEEIRKRENEYLMYRNHMNAMYDWIDSVAEAVGLQVEEQPPTLEDILSRVKELTKNSK